MGPSFIDSFPSASTTRPTRQPSQPMSAAISCTRAVAPRLAIRTLRCQRYASTQATDAVSEHRDMIIETAPVAKATTPAGKGHKNTRAPTLAERMHKALYPDLYINGRPVEGVQLPKDRQAKKTAEKKPRSTSSHHQTSIPSPPLPPNTPQAIS